MTDWAQEREDVLRRFSEELAKATGDGSKKRQAGEKPPWYRDGSHMAAVFSHLRKRELGEMADPDSGAHPYVHAAWRLLAIACSENGNNPMAEEVHAASTRGYVRLDKLPEEQHLDQGKLLSEEPYFDGVPPRTMITPENLGNWVHDENENCAGFGCVAVTD